MSEKPISYAEIILHWVVGLGIIGVVAIGIYMTQMENFALYGLHKSLGILLFTVIVIRVVIRLRKGWPENVSTGAAWERGLARVIQWVLLIATIAMPLSGMFDAYGAGRGLNVFGVNLVAPNIDDTGLRAVVSEALSSFGEAVHGIGANILIAAILLHVAGALKHHLFDRDTPLRRMVRRGTMS